MSRRNGRRWLLGLVVAALMAVPFLAAPTPIEAAYVPIPPGLRAYVEYAHYGGSGWADGVALKLTPAGIDFGKSDSGASTLAAWVMQQRQWKGSRSHANVASEIKWHCRVWTPWPAWWSNRLNPINIEYFQSWPQSIID